MKYKQLFFKLTKVLTINACLFQLLYFLVDGYVDVGATDVFYNNPIFALLSLLAHSLSF